MKDLFEHIDTLPESVRVIVEEYNLKLYEMNTYDLCEEFLDKVYKLGYTFDYGLDGCPFNLRERKIDIEEVVRRTNLTSPYYFSKDTLKFFGQTISGFKLKRMEDGRIQLSQKTKHGTKSVRFFNPQNDKLEHY
jgi:AraC-like DNA-binding protein